MAENSKIFPSCPTIHLQTLADDFLEEGKGKEDSRLSEVSNAESIAIPNMSSQLLSSGFVSFQSFGG